MHVHKRPISLITFAAGLMLLTACVTTPASAQIGEGTGLAEALNPEYFNRDIVIFTEGLDLDDTQRVIVEALFEDYLDGFDEAKAAMSHRFETMQTDMQNTTDKSSMVRMALQPLRDLIAKKDSLRMDLLAGVQTVLTDEQLAGWDSFLRRVRREKTMHKGRLDGESIDLFHIIRDMKLSEDAMYQVQPSLDEYEQALDQALIQREESFKNAQISLLDSISADQNNISTTEAERQVTLRVRIRDINDLYREQISQALPGDLGWDFRNRALQKAYPSIYRHTLMQQALEGALALEDLTAETQQAILDMQRDYLVELDSANALLLANLQQNQPEEMRMRIESFKARMSGGKPNHASTRNRQNMYQRDELSRPYMEKLESLLTPEQFAMLPQAQRFLERQRRLNSLRTLEGLAKDDPSLETTDEAKKKLDKKNNPD